MEESDAKVRNRNVVTITKEVCRDWKPWSWKYKWPDRLAVKKKLTEKEKAFVDEYIKDGNASAAFRASKGTLDKPELWSATDRANGHNMKMKEKIRSYLQEKIMSNADELLDIQMDMIRDEDTPAAVRNDAIKDRLNRIWVGKEKEESWEFVWIWEVTITIKHKQPTIIEWEEVEVLDWEKEDGETISAPVWDDWETSWGTAVSDW